MILVLSDILNQLDKWRYISIDIQHDGTPGHKPSMELKYYILKLARTT
jgi:hypothetical protein